MFLLKFVTLFVPVAVLSGNHFELSELIQRIHKESSSATLHFIGIDGHFLEYFMKRNHDKPVAIFTSLPRKNDELFHNNAAMLVVQDCSENGQYFKMLKQFILQLRVRKIVIISGHSLENLRRYFALFAENKFTRVFGMAESIAYAYLPYADRPVQMLSKSDPLPNALRDLNGFSFRTTVQKDIPRAFWYPDKHGQPQVGGCFGQTFVNFLRRHNATFKEIYLNNSTELNIPDVLNATNRNEIDISMNGYSIQKGHDNSYPVKFLSWTVMVGLNGYVNPNEYFLRPFSPTAWICIGLTLVFLIFMETVKDVLLNLPLDVWDSFSRIYLAMLNSSSHRPPNVYRFHGQVLVLAFILGNIYVIYFTSFLTVYINIKQYEWIQDLIDNKVPIMVPDYEWDMISNPDQHLPGLEDIVIIVDHAVYFRERNAMNRSFAYSIGADRGEFLIGLQTVYAKPSFRLTRDGLAAVNMIFPLAPHSPFKDILSIFIMHVTETGLIKKWDDESIAQGLSAGFQVHVDREGSVGRLFAPLTFNHLHFAWICWTSGLGLGLVVFIGELIWQHWASLTRLCQNRIF